MMTSSSATIARLFPEVADLSLGQLHEILGGQLRLAQMPPLDGEATPVGRVVTDSRQIKPGDLFWALNGPHHQGADFACEAMMRGASGVIASRAVEPWDGRWALHVADTTVALWELARWRRSRFRGSIVGVTGSVGKTTTRQMIDTVLGSRLTGSSSPANYNNHIGLPLSMLALDVLDDYAVFELGASASGEIEALAKLCAPSIAVLTRVADAHLAGFGDTQAVLNAKLELVAQIPDDGWAVLPGDDPRLQKKALECCRGKIVWFGRGANCDVIASQVESRNGTLRFVVDGARIRVPVWGRHHLGCALAAFAVGRVLGLSAGQIAMALSDHQPPPMRCAVSEIGGITVIDDSYNASPVAMQAALELLREFDAPGRKIVVCGDMRELGERSAELHQRLGDQVVTHCGADLLVSCGEYADLVVDAALRAGMPSRNAIACRHIDEVPELLRGQLAAGDVVLVKGSRTLAMERIIEKLRGTPQRMVA